MKTIEQDFINDFTVRTEIADERKVLVCDYGYSNPFELDHKGAQQLIAILQEFVDASIS